MGTLLERELIKKDFEAKYPILVQMMNQELDTAKAIYDTQMAVKQDKGKIPIHKNMPSVSGGLKWAEELKQRLAEPMGSYKHLEHPYVDFIVFEGYFFWENLPLGIHVSCKSVFDFNPVVMKACQCCKTQWKKKQESCTILDHIHLDANIGFSTLL